MMSLIFHSVMEGIIFVFIDDEQKQCITKCLTKKNTLKSLPIPIPNPTIIYINTNPYVRNKCEN